MVGTRYLVKKALGSGAGGEILQVEDRWRKGAVLAVKCVSDPVTPAKTEALESEFRILRTLTHPHVVAAIDFGRMSGGQPYFAMEYVEGKGIESAWRDLSPAVRIDLLIELCHVLQWVHAQGYVHGDLKPQNILIRSRPGPLVKLVDFGHAAPVGRRSFRVRGTPGYLAPEVLTGEPAYPSSDLYSLGMLCRQLLGEEMHPPVLNAMVAERPEMRPGNLAPLVDALRRMRPRSTGPGRPPVWGPPPFVERRRIQQRLRESLRQVLRERCPATVVLSGAEGSGRTRLIDAFRTDCQLLDCAVLTIDGSLTGAPPGSNVVRQVLETLSEAIPPDHGTVAAWGQEVLKAAPGLADHPAFAPCVETARAGLPAPLPPRAERARLWNSIAEFISRQARLQPLVICIEDAPFDDPDLVALTTALQRRADAGPLLFCLTTSPSNAAEGKDVVTIPVAELGVEETAQLFQGMLKQHPAGFGIRVSRSVARHVRRLTRGLPDRIVDLARNLERETAPEVWTQPEALEQAAASGDVQAALAGRLRQLGPDSASIVRFLTLAPRPVHQRLLDTWGRQVGLGRRAGAALMDLVRCGLVILQGQGDEAGWDLADERHVQAAGNLTRPATRRKVHAQLARAIQTFGRQLPPSSPLRRRLLERQAFHAIESGDLEGGIRAAVRAARGARDMMAHSQAIAILQHALPAARRVARRERTPRAERREVEILLEISDIAALMGDGPAEEKALKQLSTPSRRKRLRPAETARVARRQGALALIQGRHADAARHLRRAERVAAGVRSVEGKREQMRIGAATVMLNVHRGRIPEALETCTQRLRSAAPGDTRLETERASLLNYRAIAHLYLGRGADAVRDWTRAHAAYRRVDNPGGMAGVLNNLGKYHMDRGDLRRARAALRRAVGRRQRLHDVMGLADTLSNLGIVEIMAGRLPRARRLLDASLRLRQRAGDRFGEIMTRANRGEVDLLQGRYDAAEKTLQEALIFMRQARHARLCLGLEISLAAVWLATGRRGKAERTLKAAASAETRDRLQRAIALTLYAQCGPDGLSRQAAKRLDPAIEIFRGIPHAYHLGLALAQSIRARRASTGEEALGELNRIARHTRSDILRAHAALLESRRIRLLAAMRQQTLRRSEIEPILSRLDESLADLRRAGAIDLLWRIHLETARLWRLAGQRRRAHNHLRDALQLLAVLQQEVPKKARERFLMSGGRGAVRREIEFLAASVGLQPNGENLDDAEKS